MTFLTTALSNTSTSFLLDKIAEYFQNNPNCIAEHYDAQQAQERNLHGLAQYCAHPHVWYEEATMQEGSNSWRGPIRFQRTFFLHDFTVLENHGYCDEDGVQVLIEEDGSGFPTKVEIEVACH